MLHDLFLSVGSNPNLIKGSYQPSLVILSVAVSVCLSIIALYMARLALESERNLNRYTAVAMGGVALGYGIWAMHFIGMMAYKLPVEVDYSYGLTALSLLPGCIASWVAMNFLSRRQTTWPFLLGSGVLVGAGIGTMHYMGMAAMHMSLKMHYDPWLFGLSIIVAVVLAVIALWVSFGTRNGQQRSIKLIVLGGSVMGVAIAGMHYTGMAAMHLEGTAVGEVDHLITISINYIAITLSILAVTIGAMVAAVSAVMHARSYSRSIEIGRRRLEAILDTAVDSIITINEKGIVQEFNRAAEQMFGYTAEEVRGHNVKMLMPEPYHSEHDGYLQRYAETGERRLIGMGKEVVGLHKNGELIPIRLAVGEAKLPDGKRLYVGLLTDISQRQQLEQSLRETAEEAKQAAKAKIQFLANMSHEIRTPMNSVIGFSELMLRSELPKQQRRYMTTINQSARSLLGLINNILDITKIEHGRVELELLSFSLRALAQEVEASLSLQAQDKGLVLESHYPETMPAYFQGDAPRIRQILNNIINNAVKFTETGRVDVIYAYIDGQVRIQVRDTGIGMTAEQVKTVFESFTQADASINRRFGGTGLGTTIAKKLITAMGGRVEVDSVLGVGTTFTIDLPLELGQATEKPLVQGDIFASLPQLNVLIADDVEQNLELLEIILNEHGHHVVSTRDGAEVVAAYKEQGPFDIVLMDVHMPNVDGLEATRTIRRYEREQGRAYTPIVALTASVMAKDQKEVYTAGMDGFAVKPIEVVDLVQEIARVLQLNSAAENVSAHAAAQDNTAALIDWERGITLWGNKPRLVEKIQSFVEQAEQQYPLDKDRNTLKTSLHSLQGVAGNLGLMQLVKQAKQLESQLSRNDNTNTQAAIAGIKDQLQAIAESLQTQTAGAAVGGAQAQPQDFSIEKAQALKALLEQGGLDDELLEEVAASLPPAIKKQLLNAVDSFELEQAAAIVQQQLAAAETI